MVSSKSTISDYGVIVQMEVPEESSFARCTFDSVELWLDNAVADLRNLNNAKGTLSRNEREILRYRAQNVLVNLDVLEERGDRC